MSDDERQRLQSAAACAFYQAGVRCYRSMILREVLSAFEARRSTGDPINAVLSLLSSEEFGEQAALHYDTALAFSPRLAEAHYNRAALHRHAGRLKQALRSYETVLTLAPHARARAHAHLCANAAWESAIVAQGTRQAWRVRRLFHKALSGLDNFGVDHRRFPDYLDRSGRLAEAIPEYDRVMSYSHRHAPEFIEPAFDSEERLPSGPNGAPLDPLKPSVVATTDRAAAIYFLHLYFSVPKRSADTIGDALVATLQQGWLTQTFRRPSHPIDACAPRLSDLPGFAGAAAPNRDRTTSC